jgi:hypothetical protein
MREDRLALLRELERADEEAAAELAELDALYERCEEVRLGALELDVLLRGLPDEQAAAGEAHAAARLAVDEARETLERADEELRAAGAEADPERAAAASRFLVRARDALTSAERRAREAEERQAALADRARAAAGEAKSLQSRARELAAELRVRSRLAPETGEPPADEHLAALAEWGTRARAALLVARSQVAAERDAVVRQANELGGLLLGEPLGATSTAGVAERVERVVGRSA